MKDEKIVLTLASEYLEHWTVYDALRELYQNVFDKEKEDKEAQWFSEAIKVNKKINLTLGNKNTILERKTLILGVTSKKNNKNAVGKFGEGYKLAILVLLRNNIKVSLVTDNEKWTFALEHTPQFNMKMLTVTIQLLSKVNSSDHLTFTLEGIKSTTWSSYSQFNLRLQPKIKKVTTNKCDVLLDPRNRSKIFVGGLFICKYIGTSIFGYDFKPDVFQLGRDRNIIEGFSANWEASKALTDATISNVEVLENVVNNIGKSEDTYYTSNFAKSSEVLLDAMWNKFITTFPNTMPVDAEWRKVSMKKEFVSVEVTIVTEREYEVLIQSCGYKLAKKELEIRPPAAKPEEIINNFYDAHEKEMNAKLKIAYAHELMTEALNWKAIC